MESWKFFIASTAVSAVLAEELTKALSDAGHTPCKIDCDPDLVLILSLGETIMVNQNSYDALTWLRGAILGLEFGGVAIAFCPRYLNPTQREYLRLSTPELKSLEKDHGAKIPELLFSFDSTEQLLKGLLKIPKDFSISNLDLD